MITVADFKKLIKRFSFQAICDSAIYQFPEITLHMIEEKYNRLKKTDTVAEMLNIAETLPEEEFNARYSKLKLLMLDELATKIWYVWKLKLVKPVAERRDRIFRLKEYLEQQWIQSDIEMILLPEKYLFSVIRQTIKSGRIKNMAPVVFQYFFNQPYLFCGRKYVKTSIMRGVIGSLGYDLFKQIDVNGTNVLNLLYILAIQHDADAKAKAEAELSAPESEADQPQLESETSTAHEQESSSEEIEIEIQPPPVKKAKVQETIATTQVQFVRIVPMAPSYLQNSAEVAQPSSSKPKNVMPIVLLEQFVPRSTVKSVPRTEVDIEEIIEAYDPYLGSGGSRAPSHSQQLQNESFNKRVVVHKIIGANQPQYETLMPAASSCSQSSVKESTKQEAVQSTTPKDGN